MAWVAAHDAHLAGGGGGGLEPWWRPRTAVGPVGLWKTIGGTAPGARRKARRQRHALRIPQRTTAGPGGPGVEARVGVRGLARAVPRLPLPVDRPGAGSCPFPPTTAPRPGLTATCEDRAWLIRPWRSVGVRPRARDHPEEPASGIEGPEASVLARPQPASRPLWSSPVANVLEGRDQHGEFGLARRRMGSGGDVNGPARDLQLQDSMLLRIHPGPGHVPAMRRKALLAEERVAA